MYIQIRNKNVIIRCFKMDIKNRYSRNIANGKDEEGNKNNNKKLLRTHKIYIKNCFSKPHEFIYKL